MTRSGIPAGSLADRKPAPAEPGKTVRGPEQTAAPAGVADASEHEAGGLVYAGIGSRQTPPEMLEAMTELARELERSGWHLHSGGADGADTAFENGTTKAGRTVYLPWKRLQRPHRKRVRDADEQRAVACAGNRVEVPRRVGALFERRTGAARTERGNHPRPRTCTHRPAGRRCNLLDTGRRDTGRDRHWNEDGANRRYPGTEPGARERRRRPGDDAHDREKKARDRLKRQTEPCTAPWSSASTKVDG